MKKNQLETLEMIIVKKRNTVDGLDSRVKFAVEEIIKLEDPAKKFFPDAARKDKEIGKVLDSCVVTYVNDLTVSYVTEGTNTVRIESVHLRIIFCGAVGPGQTSHFKKLMDMR